MLMLLCFDTVQIDIESNVTLVKIQGQGVDKEPKGLLQIDPHSGIITVHGEVDYEEFKVLMVRWVFSASLQHHYLH